MYVYPDSPRYSRRQFDAVARLYVEERLGVLAVEGRTGVGHKTAGRFLRLNGLLRPREAARLDALARRKAGRALAARRLAAEGRAVPQIAAALGVTTRSVFRYLAPRPA